MTTIDRRPLDLGGEPDAAPSRRGFRFGAATAAYQIEGAVRRGRARRVDLGSLLRARPGAVANGDTGDVACDHYHRWAADLDLMAALGLETLPLLDRLAARAARRARRR